MTNLETSISGLKIMNNPIHKDERGIFFESFNKTKLAEFDIQFDPKQMNVSSSKKNALRGMHYTEETYIQNKLVSCVNGSVLDVTVDLRINSETYLKVFCVKLNALDGIGLFVPSGVGHSFLALEESSTVSYLLDSTYNPTLEFTVSPFSKDFKIDWPGTEFIMSSKDLNAPNWSDVTKRKSRN
jgi:dTDP-4-dehydrorhamnose 3,5-epimerase